VSWFNPSSTWLRIFESSVALDYLAEVTEQLLPPNETNERHFHPLIAALNYLHAGGSIWVAVTYFALWSVRLAGFHRTCVCAVSLGRWKLQSRYDIW
jgi:hypothetical protein